MGARLGRETHRRHRVTPSIPMRKIATVCALAAALMACKKSAAPTTIAADASPKPKATMSDAFVDRAINHVLSTGQSLSVGLAGYPPLSLTQPYANIMFATGVVAGGKGLTSFVPLTEGAVD